MVRLDNVWGVGGASKPVKYLVSHILAVKTSVSDPYSFDMDPAFKAKYRSGSRALMTKN
jgi:hypothetical protein